MAFIPWSTPRTGTKSKGKLIKSNIMKVPETEVTIIPKGPHQPHPTPSPPKETPDDTQPPHST